MVASLRCQWPMLMTIFYINQYNDSITNLLKLLSSHSRPPPHNKNNLFLQNETYTSSISS